MREAALRQILSPGEAECVLTAKPQVQLVPHKEPPAVRITEEPKAPVHT